MILEAAVPARCQAYDSAQLAERIGAPHPDHPHPVAVIIRNRKGILARLYRRGGLAAVAAAARHGS